MMNDGSLMLKDLHFITTHISFITAMLNAVITPYFRHYWKHLSIFAVNVAILYRYTSAICQ